MEVWKDIQGFEGFYQVSNNGNVRSLPRKQKDRRGSGRCFPGRLLKPSVVDHGYLKVSLMKGGIRYDRKLSRIVAEAFIPNPDNKPEVNHKNGNKNDNSAENLEWSTRKENIQHAFDTGLNPTNRKLTDEDVEYIKFVYRPQSTKFGTVALAKKFGVSNATIWRVINKGYLREEIRK